jgi:hypothetical protein
MHASTRQPKQAWCVITQTERQCACPLLMLCRHPMPSTHSETHPTGRLAGFSMCCLATLLAPGPTQHQTHAHTIHLSTQTHTPVGNQGLSSPTCPSLQTALASSRTTQQQCGCSTCWTQHPQKCQDKGQSPLNVLHQASTPARKHPTQAKPYPVNG